MAKITLDSILSGFNLSKINSNFQKIQDALNNQVWYRDNPVGEANTPSGDVDMNGKNILNVGTLGVTSSFQINGIDLATQVQNAANSATAASTSATNAATSETNAVNSATAAAASAASVNDTNIVHKTGNETIAGVKTFTSDTKVVSLNGHSLSGMINRIFNGDARIDQANGGAAVTTTSGSPATIYPIDRFKLYSEATTGTISGQRLGGDGPTGFSNYLRIKITTAGTIAPNGPLYFGQVIEGLNISDLGFGTSSASSVTLSFWYRSSVSGLHSGAIKSGDGLRTYPFSFTVNSVNTWEYKTITIAGDTTGTWASDNTAGMYVVFNIGSGGSKTGTAGAWTTSQVWGVTGAAYLLGTLNSTIDITGIQLEAGTVSTPFERVDYGEMLKRCQRYCYKLGPTASLGSGIWYSTTSVIHHLFFPVTMRAIPTYSVDLVTSTAIGAGITPSVNAGNTVLGSAYVNGAELQSTTATAGTAGQGAVVRMTSGSIVFRCEL